MTFDVAAAIFATRRWLFRLALLHDAENRVDDDDRHYYDDVGRKLFLPPEELLTAVRIPEIIAATMSISVIGSINCFNKRRIIGSFYPLQVCFCRLIQDEIPPLAKLCRRRPFHVPTNFVDVFKIVFHKNSCIYR